MRTLYKLRVRPKAYSITVTAREIGALSRFLNRKTVAGDVALVEGVIRKIVE